MNLDDGLRDLNAATFDNLKKRKLLPSQNLTGLRLLQAKAVRERDLRELHRTESRWGRAPYELLQNADDAGATHAVFILAPDGLAFAHDGRWFTVDNFYGLAEGWSDKKPGECIGHKGLGFRSVLDITPAPYIFRVHATDFFGVKFTWAVNNGHIDQTVKQDADAREFRDRMVKQRQPYCPVMAIPAVAKKASAGTANIILSACARRQYKSNLTTLFWFPAEDSELPASISATLGTRPITLNDEGRRMIREFVTRDLTTILPFVTRLQTVSVFEVERSLCSATRFPTMPTAGSAEVTVTTEENGIEISSRRLFVLREPYPIPRSIKDQRDSPLAVKSMERANVALAVDLEDQPVPDTSAAFHVYFPTEESTGTGFTIHGDFYVKPDRTRLMPGEYNAWLLERAAKLAAGTFLDHLLEKYRPARIYEALAPTRNSSSEAGAAFLKVFRQSLSQRTKPFVSTGSGMASSNEVALPPLVDPDGFWDTHFSKALPRLEDGKRAFLSPKEDTRNARLFLQLAGIEPLPQTALLDMLEAAGQENEQNAKWWFDSYSYLANDSFYSRQGHDIFAGRRILLTGQGVIAVPKSSELIVSLPPSGAAEELALPSLFREAFVLINTKLAALLDSGPDTVEGWVRTRFQVSRFEATELIPRTVIRAAQDIFRGKVRPTPDELADAWTFILKTVNLSPRRIESSGFWQDVGRFPVIVESRDDQSQGFVPAFLTYWPDSLLDSSSPLSGVGGLRRLAPTFLGKLESRGGAAAAQWHYLLDRAGISRTPKLLQFSRVLMDEPTIVDRNGNLVPQTLSFRGDRQADENSAVISSLMTRRLWEENITPAGFCTHGGQFLLQSFTWIDSLTECVTKALDEFRDNDSHWKERLWNLIRSVPFSDASLVPEASIFCRGGSTQGHSISIGNPVVRQLRTLSWLPSSLGPVPSGLAFCRLTTRHLIEVGRGEELGDSLLPYVVAADANDLDLLRRLGVDVLDDAPSASPQVLARALRLLGDTLSAEPMREQVLGQPGRWRLVRGAIQEMYRALNQAATIPALTATKLAIRTRNGRDFSSGPFYFADPGSPVHRGFIDRIALIDVDRPFRRLFDEVGVTHLLIGQTVEETLLDADKAVKMVNLESEIREILSPYLLALILVRGDREHAGLVARRLRERFEVFSMRALRVSLALKSDETLRVEAEFPCAYLRKFLVPGRGAVEEAHYSLYMVAAQNADAQAVDGDALGEVLGRIFLDGTSDELMGHFARIVMRYQHDGGNHASIETFLLEHLGISKEAQEEARMMLCGDMAGVPRESPPPAIVVAARSFPDSQNDADLAPVVAKHLEQFQTQAQSFVQSLAAKQTTDATRRTSPTPVGTSSATPVSSHITPEQQLRGRRGEEEILRRLGLPGGWEGFSLVADHRDPPRGYDFLASLSGGEVKLEVKTFMTNGQVVVTEGELREAAASRRDYYLVGVVNSGGPPNRWQTVIVRDPLEILLTRGQFSSKLELRVSGDAIIDLDARHRN